MHPAAEDTDIGSEKRFWTRKRTLWTVGALGLAGILAYPTLDAAGDRSYIRRCVEHRSDSCGDREEAQGFCRKNPTAYVDNPAPVVHRSAQESPYMPEAEKAIDRCETAYLYHHRNDGPFDGLFNF